MALALYRKYRPRKLEDFIGHETNILVLQNAARAGRLGHAYLFYGSRGTGKTTAARILAKLANCERRAENAKFAATGEPCNECRNCREIDSGTSLDVIEIDAASNRGIDEIRDLRNSIRMAPTSGKHKVYIIDEAHMLTGAAFNALLKTLEEPPPHGIIILATTEFDKLPSTITSRTQRFLFKKLSKPLIMEKLAYIAREEKIQIDDGALELIAASADGSFRDAESLLDQVRNTAEKLDIASVERLIGRVALKKVEHLAGLLIARKKEECLAYLAALCDEGDNVISLTKDLIHYLRKVLTLAVNPSLEESFKTELTQSELDIVKEYAKAASPEFLIKLLRAFIRAYSEMRYSPFAAIPLEVVIIENLSQT